MFRDESIRAFLLPANSGKNIARLAAAVLFYLILSAATQPAAAKEKSAGTPAKAASAPRNAKPSGGEDEKRASAKKADEETAGKIRLGDQEFRRKNYPAALDFYMQALVSAPDGKTARERLRKTADKILEPEKKRIAAERARVMAEYRKVMAKRKVESLSALYSKAVSYYNRKYFLKSYETIAKVYASDPDYKNVKFYHDSIADEMRTTSLADTLPDVEKLSYAKGFAAFYFDKNIAEASRQWERVLAINPRRTEVSEYLKNAKSVLEAMERDKRIAEITARLSALYGSGRKEFDEAKFVPAIKEWEKVVQLARKEPDVPESPSWEAKAQEGIKTALAEIEKLATRKRPPAAKPSAPKPAEPEPVIDEASANRYYQEGMVAYAQGRLREAVRLWDLSLRMNPGHDRARKAKERAEAELSGGR